MIKKYFFSGLLILAPIWVTLMVIDFLLHAFDKVIALLPAAYQPEALFGFPIPGLSLLIILLLILLIGVLASNVFGNYLVALWDRFLARIPLVRTIHTGVKQVMQAVLSSEKLAFRKVLLVEYPRAGMWSIAFQTSNGISEINKNAGQDLITVFIPTTPNPTSGFLLLLPAKDAIELNMSVDSALKLVISLGVIVPSGIK